MIDKERKEEMLEQEVSDYFAEPSNQLPKASLVEAISAAVKTIYDFNDMLPQSKRFDNPMDHLSNKYGQDCEMTLLDFIK